MTSKNYAEFDRLINLAIQLQTIADYPEPNQVPEVAAELHRRAVRSLECALAVSRGLTLFEQAAAGLRLTRTADLLKVRRAGNYTYKAAQ